MLYQAFYFFAAINLKYQYTSRITRLKNALFHNKIHLKKDYFAKEIDLLEALSQRKSPF
jgi:hypothetical protein